MRNKSEIIKLNDSKALLNYWPTWADDYHDLIDTLRQSTDKTMTREELVTTLWKESDLQDLQAASLRTSQIISQLKKLGFVETN
jgi:hypothetical protein